MKKRTARRQAATGFPEARIADHRGVPAVFVDGRPVPPMGFLVRHYFDYRYMRRYVESGHRICFVDVKRQYHLSDEEHLAWLDERLARIAALADDLYIVLAPYVSFDEAWDRAHPGELTRYEDGSVKRRPEGPMAHFGEYPAASVIGTYSFASRVFERDGIEQLLGYVRFLRTRPYARQVVGFFPEAGSTHEWNVFAGPAAHDFSPAMTQAFRRHLRKTYRNVAALRRAWGDRRVTFENARVPTSRQRAVAHRGYFRDPSVDRRVIDYYTCASREMTDRMIAFARAIKEETGRRLLVGFYGGATQDGNPGGLEWVRYQRCPWIDFGASPLAYEQRGPGAHSPLHQVVDSLHLHGKVFFSEDDLRPAWPVRDARAERSVRRLGGTSLPKSLEIFKREIMQNVVGGVQGWWYDFHYRWYERPAYWRLFERFNELFDLSFRHDRRKHAQIAIVFDEESHRYFAPTNRINRSLYHRQMINEMGRLGASADMIMHDDLGDAKLPEYKLYVFLNCFRLTTRERRAIEKLKRGGRTLLFFYGAGYVNDDRRDALSVANMRGLTGIAFREIDEDRVPLVTMAEGAHPLQRSLSPGAAFGAHWRLIPGHGFPPAYRVSPLFAVDDDEAEVLGYYCYQHDVEPALAVKEFDDWRSIYTGTIQAPASLLRAAARLAGCHLYVDTDDVFYASRKFLVIHESAGPGPRRIELPRAETVWDVFTGKRVCRRARSFDIDLGEHQTRAFFLGPRSREVPYLIPVPGTPGATSPHHHTY